MPNVIPFNFNNTDVRVIERDGEPWFVAKDVATILGYTNPQDAVRRHCKAPQAVGGERNTHPSAVDPQTVIIPERDLYRLVMRSRLPSAERFEEWVVGEVIPQIRKTGGYNAAPVPDFTNPAEAARLWAEQYDLARRAEAMLLEHVPMEKPSARQAERNFFNDTAGMTIDIKGPYCVLMRLIKMHNGRLPDDARYISGQLGCTPRKWTQTIRATLIETGKIEIASLPDAGGIHSNIIRSGRARKAIPHCLLSPHSCGGVI